MKENPLPNHGSHTVNAIINEDSLKVVHLVEDVRTPWSVISKSMQKHNALEGVHDNCELCKTEPERCEKLKDCVQELMDQGVLQFYRNKAMGEVLVIKPIEIIYRKKQVEASIKKVQPIVFHVPSPFPYQNSKVVLWRYNETILVGGKEVQVPSEEIINISGPTGMTHSGRVFVPKYAPTVVPTTVPFPQAGASVGVPTTPVETPDSSKRDNSLDSTISKGKEAHRKDLLKVLNTTHVMQDILVDQFGDVIANSSVSKYLGFNEAELTAEGHNYNKALHISVTCTNALILWVLVDTGSSLNVLPKSILSQLQYEEPKMRASTLIVRAFNGSQREVIREVDLPICVGSHQFNITFQVMDIHPTYSYLLEWPWIHATGAVTSILHQN
ncbi:uncharacterized protein LOC127094446 [Lathyrus oleraceus]|uniref:uncharacterized protein LOC127094446 n=1 Tax=Pisum sativum TaxID=3888 RepID=UPI0021D1CB08|nr:uncharacterized protein LOC127094446 [Pisum sativum]